MMHVPAPRSPSPSIDRLIASVKNVNRLNDNDNNKVQDHALPLPRVGRLQPVVGLVVQDLGRDVGLQLVVGARVEQAGDERPLQRRPRQPEHLQPSQSSYK